MDNAQCRHRRFRVPRLVSFCRSFVVVAALALPAVSSYADTFEAQLAYNAKNYDRAFKEFLDAAQLGEPNAAYGVAAMYFRGEGTPRNYIDAYAWATLALQLGNLKAKTIVDEVKPLLSEFGLRTAAEIVAPYQPEHLQELLPILDDTQPAGRERCRTPAKVNWVYPLDASDKGIQGMVVVEATIAPDGRSRAARLIQAVPTGIFDATVLDGIAHTLFVPARENGTPVGCKLEFMVRFAIAGLSAADYPDLQTHLKKTKLKAESGDISAQLLYGFMISGLPQLGRQKSEALPWFLKAAQAGHPVGAYEIGQALLLGWGCRCEENKALFWLQRAAAAGQANAQLSLAAQYLRSNPSSEALANASKWLERAAAAKNPDAQFYLAAFLATNTESARRDPPRALNLLKEVAKFRKIDPIVSEIAAASYAQLADFGAARREQLIAIQKATKLQWDIAALQQRLANYEQGQPWIGNLFTF